MTVRSPDNELRFVIFHWSLVIICQISLRVLRVSAVRLFGCGWAALCGSAAEIESHF